MMTVGISNITLNRRSRLTVPVTKVAINERLQKLHVSSELRFQGVSQLIWNRRRPGASRIYPINEFHDPGTPKTQISHARVDLVTIFLSSGCRAGRARGLVIP
jgi:hypothetical protein